MGLRAQDALCEMRLFAKEIEMTARITGVWKLDVDYKWILKSATDLFHYILYDFCFSGSKSYLPSNDVTMHCRGRQSLISSYK